jgi:cell division protein FtsQ
MSRLTRAPRNSVNDRPGRMKLMLRRQRRRLRPAGWLGFATLILLLGVMVHSAEPGGALGHLRAMLLNATGFGALKVTRIEVEGRANTPEPLLRAALGVTLGDPILRFSVERAERRIETLSWVAHATVERRLPGTIVVWLQERRPFAIWQDHGKFTLIDRTGQMVTNQNVADFRQLPLVVGPGAPAGAANLIDALNNHPRIQGRVVAAVRVGERRWNLQMKSGMTIKLPEGHEAAALDRLSQLEHQHKLFDRPLAWIDMRLPHELILHPLPAAAAAPTNGAGAPQPSQKKQT